MLTFKNTIDKQLDYPFPVNSLEELIFFDIETTGFAAEISSVYLIGVVYFQDGHFYTIQWFADTYDSEKKLLTQFFSFLKHYQYLIHYNGTTFDMPYLLKKCKQYNLEFDFSHIISWDIYKLISPYKAYFPIKSLKLKTLETFLNIHRDDTYDGKQLIKIYVDYMKAKFSYDTSQNTLLETLLLHNYEDIVNLLPCCSILFYIDWFQKDPIIQDIQLFGDTLIFHLKHPLAEKILHLYPICSIPAIEAQKNDIYFNSTFSDAKLKVPIYTGELKYFYSNYKDYFYLPKEDTAIHKSVAIYVEKEFREKAKRSNCYIRQTGRFLWQPTSAFTPAFKKEHSSKDTYLSFDDTFLANMALVKKYVQMLLHHFC